MPLRPVVVVCDCAAFIVTLVDVRVGCRWHWADQTTRLRHCFAELCLDDETLREAGDPDNADVPGEEWAEDEAELEAMRLLGLPTKFGKAGKARARSKWGHVTKSKRGHGVPWDVRLTMTADVLSTCVQQDGGKAAHCAAPNSGSPQPVDVLLTGSTQDPTEIFNESFYHKLKTHLGSQEPPPCQPQETLLFLSHNAATGVLHYEATTVASSEMLSALMTALHTLGHLSPQSKARPHPAPAAPVGPSGTVDDDVEHTTDRWLDQHLNTLAKHCQDGTNGLPPGGVGCDGSLLDTSPGSPADPNQLTLADELEGFPSPKGKHTRFEDVEDHGQPGGEEEEEEEGDEAAGSVGPGTLEELQAKGITVGGVGRNTLGKANAKYWNQRYLLFSRFDHGIWIDKEGWYSVTPEGIAKHIAEYCQAHTVVDAFCGVGGNTIQFALYCDHVIAIDMDPIKLECARHNAEVYGVAHKVDFILGDFMQLAATLKADMVFLSPPWGGPEYRFAPVFDLRQMIRPDGFDVFSVASQITANIIYYVPRNCNLHQLVELAGGTKCEIQQCFVDRKVKVLTAYYGALAQKHVSLIEGDVSVCATGRGAPLGSSAKLSAVQVKQH